MLYFLLGSIYLSLLTFWGQVIIWGHIIAGAESEGLFCVLQDVERHAHLSPPEARAPRRSVTVKGVCRRCQMSLRGKMPRLRSWPISFPAPHYFNGCGFIVYFSISEGKLHSF